jgi:hypothetical protein
MVLSLLPFAKVKHVCGASLVYGLIEVQGWCRIQFRLSVRTHRRRGEFLRISSFGAKTRRILIPWRGHISGNNDSWDWVLRVAISQKVSEFSFILKLVYDALRAPLHLSVVMLHVL